MGSTRFGSYLERVSLRPRQPRVCYVRAGDAPFAPYTNHDREDDDKLKASGRAQDKDWCERGPT